MTIHPSPRQACARYHARANLATEEQKRAALGYLADTYPEDLLGAWPGAPVIGAEAVEVPAPMQYRLERIGRRLNFIAAGVAVFLIGLIVGELLALAAVVGRM